MSINNLKEFASNFKPSGYVQWDIYQILKHAFCPYRNIQVKSQDITKDELMKNLQFDNYIKFEGFISDEKKEKKSNKDETFLIALLNQNDKGYNEISQTTEKFRLFINNIKSDKVKKIIIVTPSEFSTHVLNYIYDVPNLPNMLSIYNYDRFKTIIPLGIYVPVHKLLTDVESQEIINYHKIDITVMKKISINDPQITWLGGEIGQYVSIVRLSSIAGYSTELRKITVA